MMILILILGQGKTTKSPQKRKAKSEVFIFFIPSTHERVGVGLSLPSSQLLWPLPFVYHKTIQLIYAPPSLLPYPLRQRPSASPPPPHLQSQGGTVGLSGLTRAWPKPLHPPPIAVLLTRAGAAWAEGEGALLLFSPRSYLAESRFSGDLSDVDYNEVEDGAGCFPVGFTPGVYLPPWLNKRGAEGGGGVVPVSWY